MRHKQNHNRVIQRDPKYERIEGTDIQEAPKNWNGVRLADISNKFISGGTPSTKKPEYWDGEIPWMRSAWIKKRTIDSGERHITEEGLENSASNIVPRGNVLVATRVSMGSVAINEIDIAISQDLTGIVINKEKTCPEFIYWDLANSVNKIKSLVQGSTIKGMLREDLKNLKVFLPPLPEQHKIASILSTVDDAIQKTDEIIRKTQELKRGLMQELLTRGIGHKKFKRTGIGEIPEEWGLKTVNEICEKPQYGYTQSAKEKPVGPKFLRITDIQDGGVNWDEVPYCECPADLINKYLLRPGDILFARTGATTGKSYVIKECPKAVFASYLIRIRTKRGIDPNFLFSFFNSQYYWKQVKQNMVGSAQGGMNATLLSKTKVQIPSPHEQHKIASILLAIEEKIEKERQRKEQLEKLKKGLMQDLLMGRIRVKT